MESHFSFVCAYANVSTAGNINASEIFTSIGAQSYPCVHPMLMYVARLQFSNNETGIHKFRLLFMGENGVEIVPPVCGNIQVSNAALFTNLILCFKSISFPAAGTYWLDLSIDGKHITTEALQLVKIAQ